MDRFPSPYWLLSPSEENRVSRRPSVVVMQPIEDRVCDDTTICLGCSRHGLFLPKALVWPSLVEEADVLRDEAQMVLPEHEHRVEQFAPQGADEALGEGVHVRCPDRSASDLCTDGLEQGRKTSAQLGVAIDDEHFWLDVQRCVSRLPEPVNKNETPIHRV